MEKTMTIDREFALKFANEWIGAANARDFDRGLALYAEDVEVASPYIRIVMNEPSGRLRGKDKLRDYWMAGMTKRAEIRFELLDVFVGADSVAIHYINRGQPADELFYFDDRRKIIRSAAHYLESK
jgi:ketosteroid isomerase-like protein